jgi:hypothetical protein
MKKFRTDAQVEKVRLGRVCMCVRGVNLQKRKVVDLIRRLSPTSLCLSLSLDDDKKRKMPIRYFILICGFLFLAARDKNSAAVACYSP